MTILSNRGMISFLFITVTTALLLSQQPGVSASPLLFPTRSLPKSRGHPLRTASGGKSREATGGRSCNSTLDAGFVSLRQTIDAFTTVDRKCSLNSTAGSIPNESPFSKLSPACVVGIDTILYELSNSSTAFTEAVQRCANNGNSSSSGGHLTPKEEKCQNALSSITKYEFISAVEFPAIVEACDHNPNGYDCKSGVVVLILSAVKLIGLQPEMISNCIF